MGCSLVGDSPGSLPRGRVTHVREMAARVYSTGLFHISGGGWRGSSSSACTRLWPWCVITAGVGNISAWECLFDLGKDSTEASEALSCCWWLEGGRQEREPRDSVCCLVSQGYQCSWLGVSPLSSGALTPSGVATAWPNKMSLEVLVLKSLLKII